MEFFRFFILFLLSGYSFSLQGQMSSYSKEIVQRDTMGYWLYSPVEIQERSYPLVIFLHGGGEGGDDIDLVKRHGFPKLIDQGRKFPFYMLAPQNPSKSGFWDDQAVDGLVDDIINNYPNIDKQRLYLVGLSRGGYGTWRMAINHPDKYAAMVSICAASIPMIYVNLLSEMPIWFFHGKKDTVVPVEQTIDAYAKLKESNDNIRLTLYPEMGHDSWSATFENDEVIEWMLSHRKN